jgi:Tyrosine phosphatase family
MTAMKRSRRTAVWAIRLSLAVVIVPALYLAWDQANYNFGVVRPDHIYRSGQMPPQALARTITAHRIRTVLNLRGSNSVDSWYRDEVAATNQASATQIDIAMSSCVWMSREQLAAVIETLDSAEYPLLIHCAWGSERTGLVSAFAELLRPGSTLDDARAQFSLAYLFVRLGDGQVMAEHLDQYESWLIGQNLHHTPANFRRWVRKGFKPGLPNREQWPHDPYPLVVITRPGAKPEVRSAVGIAPGQTIKR